MRGYSAAESEARVGRLARLLRSSIGGKFLMAVTGLFLLLFVIGHLIGNLQVLRGPDAINAYAQWLHDHTGFLWTARIGIFAIFLVHVFMAIRLDLANQGARPERYRYKAVVQATLTSRTMLVTGLLVFAYVLFHLLHFTFQAIDTGGMGRLDAKGRMDVYSMVVTGFQQPVIVFAYVVANLVLGFHLWHAIGSMFQTLGWDHPTFRPVGRVLAVGLPILIVAGYVLIPVTILAGLVT